MQRGRNKQLLSMPKLWRKEDLVRTVFVHWSIDRQRLGGTSVEEIHVYLMCTGDYKLRSLQSFYARQIYFCAKPRHFALRTLCNIYTNPSRVWKYKGSNFGHVNLSLSFFFFSFLSFFLFFPFQSTIFLKDMLDLFRLKKRTCENVWQRSFHVQSITSPKARVRCWKNIELNPTNQNESEETQSDSFNDGQSRSWSRSQESLRMSHDSPPFWKPWGAWGKVYGFTRHRNSA